MQCERPSRVMSGARMARRTIAPNLLLTVLLLLLPSSLLAQIAECLPAYQMLYHPSGPPSNPLDRELIVIHGYVVGDNLPPRPPAALCERVVDTDRLRDYWGVGGSEQSEMAMMLEEARAAGYSIRFWKWPTNFGMSDAARQLKLWIADNSIASEIVLLGHSLGGLVALEALTTTLTGPDLRARTIRVITLGTPHLGTTSGWITGTFGGAAQEVRPDEWFMGALRARRTAADNAITYMLGGRVSSGYLCKGTLADRPDGDDDCVVSVASAYDGGPGLNESTGPNRELLNGGEWDGYDHSQIALLYGRWSVTDWNGLPGDATRGDALRQRLRRLLITDMEPQIEIGATSINLVGGGSSELEITPANPGALTGLAATVESSTGGDWLSALVSASRATATDPASLLLTANIGGLLPGVYSAVVRLDAVRAPAVRVTVSVTVAQEASPVLTATPLVLSGGGTVQLSWTSVPGATSYTWEHSADQSFGSPSSFVTTATNASDVIAVGGSTVLRHYRVRANNSGFSNEVVVTATPVSSANIIADPSLLRVEAFTGGVSSVTPVALTIPGSPSFTWSAVTLQDGGPNGWLRLQIASGNQADPVRVRVDPVNILAAGTYTGRVEVRSPQAGSTPLVIPVTLIVTSAANSGIDLAVDTVYWEAGRQPCNGRTSLRLHWRVRNIGSSTWSIGTDLASDYIFWNRSPDLTVEELMRSRAELDASRPFAGTSTLAPGSTYSNYDAFDLPDNDCPLGRSYLYVLADAPWDWDDGNWVGTAPESNDTDRPRPNNLYVLEMFNPRPPNLQVAPADTSLTVRRGETVTFALRMENLGDLPMQWQAASDSPHLNLSQSEGEVSGGATSQLFAVISSSGLAAGEYSLRALFTGNGAVDTVTVALTVVPTPLITVSERFVQLRAISGDVAHVGGLVRIENGGDVGSVLDGLSAMVLETNGALPSWLSATSVASALAPTSLTFAASAEDLAPGTYSADIRIVAADGVPAEVITVTLLVEAPLQLAVTPTTVTRQWRRGTPVVVDSVAVTLTGAGAPSAAWNASASGVARWVTIPDSSGAGSGWLRVLGPSTDLAPGSYVDTIAIAATGAAGSPANVIASIEVLPGLPDLTPSALEAPSTAFAGETVRWSFVVGNRGETPVGGEWVGRLGLTTDTRCAAGPSVAAVAFNGDVLAAGDSATVSGEIRVPNTLAPGSYAWCVILDDPLSTVAERDESNNVAVGPNLVVVAGATLTLVADPDSAGDVAFVAGLAEGIADRDVVVRAEAATGHLFRYWRIDGDSVSDANPYTFALPSDLTLVAVFGAITNLGVEAGAGGTAQQTGGSASGLAGRVVEVTASAETGQYFRFWAIAGDSISIANPYSFTLDGDVNIRAVFSPPARLTFRASPLQGGSVVLESGTEVGPVGRAVTLRAISTDPYRHGGWMWGTNGDGPSNPRSFVMSGDLDVSAVFYTLQPDLRVWSIVTNPSPELGRTYDLTFEVRNNGYTGASADWPWRILLSSDSLPSEGDRELARETYQSPIPVGQRVYLTTRVEIPSDVAPGAYHLIVELDPDNVFVENDDANNARALAVAVVAPTRTIGLEAVPAVGGTVSVDSGALSGAPDRIVRLRATPNVNFELARWIYRRGGAADTLGGTSPIDVAITDDGVIQAEFSPTATVTLSATPVGAGEAALMNAGALVGPVDRTVTALASPAEGFLFRYWTLDGDSISAGNPYELVLSRSRALTAVFGADVRVSLAAEGEGSAEVVTGGAGGLAGRAVTVAATPATGWLFRHWRESTDSVGVENPYSFVVSSPRSLTAVFGQSATLALATSGGGSANQEGGGATGLSGRSVTVVATPSAGNIFRHWAVGTDSIAAANPYTFPLTSDLTLTARFGADVIITLAGAPTNAGTLSFTAGSANGLAGRSVTVLAQAAAGHALIGWFDGAGRLSRDPSLTFVVTTGRTLTARFLQVNQQFLRRALRGLVVPSELSISEMNDLDLVGNANGAYDLGDLLALLDRPGVVMPAARTELLRRIVP